MKKAHKFCNRLVCICLVLSIAASNSLVFASGPESAHSMENNLMQELNGIPIYFDFVEPINSSSGQNSVTVSEPNEASSGNEVIANEELEICESIQLSAIECQALFEMEPFLRTLERAQEVVAEGGSVEGIHFLLPVPENGSDLSISEILASDDWHIYTRPLRTYNGYEFRYLDSYIDGETGYVSADEIGTVDWKEVVSTGLKALIPTAISAFGAPVIGATLGVAITVSDFIDQLTVRPNLKYSYNEESYIKYNALYRHTMRSFYISDENDLVSGFDYYIVGTAEKAEIDNHILARWPTISGWDSGSGQVGPRNVITTSGFYGASSFLSNLIQSYNLQRNYHENIDLRNTLIDIILNDDAQIGD